MDDTTLVLKGDTAGIVPGKILISTDGYGYLRKVISVSNTPDGLRVVTEQASLAEAFSELDIHIDKVFGPDDFGQVIETGTPEISAEFRNTSTTKQIVSGVEITGPELSLTFNGFGVSQNTGIQITGGASFKVNAKWDMALKKNNNGRSALQYRFEANPNYRHNITVQSKFSGSISMKKERNFALGRFIIPGTPIVVVPTVIFEANVKGTAAGAFGATYTASVSGGAYIQRNINGNTTTGTTYQPLQTAKFDLAEETLQASATPASMKLEFRLYNIAGPSMGLEAVAEMSGTFESTSAGPVPERGPYIQTWKEGIRAKAAGKINGSMGVGGKIPFVDRFFDGLDGDFSLINVPINIAEIELANEYFPFQGKGIISAGGGDNKWEVSLDGKVLGQTTFQDILTTFELTNLRPGVRKLTAKLIHVHISPSFALEVTSGLNFPEGGVRRIRQFRVDTGPGTIVNIDLTVLAKPDPCDPGGWPFKEIGLPMCYYDNSPVVNLRPASTDPTGGV
jgi:hypothetical protein